ncbi:MAG: metallophosphoesterase [Chitinophagales bacterium]|nr:metallophosphoesterase [Chitinophagales bacterium]
MNNRFTLTWMLVPLILLILVDIYVFQAVRSAFTDARSSQQRIAYITYWSLSAITYIVLAVIFTKNYQQWHGWDKNLMIGVAQAIFFGKLLLLPFLLIDDLLRVGRWAFSFFNTTQPAITQANGISRLQFLSRIGLGIGTFTMGGMLYGILRGAFNYQIKKIPLAIPQLPAAFEGLKIVQISDMHLGSFADNSPVEKIVELVNAQQPDMIFFTGDLVNYAAKEIHPHIPALSRLKASQGIYSVLGNHDYGMYLKWEKDEDRIANFNELLHIQREQLGWDLLMDEHRIVERDGHQLAIIGVQYIGHNLRFASFGNLKKAYAGAENAAVQLLLSHDPSHWDKEVSVAEDFKNIHTTFSGHTHGFQFGIEVPKINLQWSPSQYVYPHWAGLYRQEQQQLYVNRGIGFLGYPGRLGISPEITVFRLTKA